MAEGLATADGERVDLDATEQEFAAAMAAPAAGGPEQPEPPDIGVIDPEAPFGRKLDGTPKKTPGGRPPNRDKPRVTDRPAPKAITGGKASGGGKGEPPPASQYKKGLSELVAGMSLALAIVPVPERQRVHCRYQSAVLEKTGDGLASGLAICAEHNGAVRWAVERLTSGGGAWALPAAMAIAPFAVSTAMLWKSEVTDAMKAGADRIEKEAMDRLKAEMGLDVDEDQADEDQAAQAA